MSDMEWEDLEPIVKTVPWCKASISVNIDGKPRLCLNLSEPAMQDCGHPKKANVQVGNKDGKTMVRMVWAPDGKFDVRNLELGGGRIHAIPVKAPVPDGARDLEPCELVSKDKKEAIFVLPLDAWQAQLNQPVVRSTAKLAETPAKPAAVAPPRPAQSIDAATYLRAKGIQISKMAGDWWMLQGHKVPRMEVLARVNEFRKDALLPALAIDQIE